jgi:AraC-like DNA-binding protein
MTRQEKGEGFPGQRIVVLPRTVVAGVRIHPVLRHLLPTDAGYFPAAAGHLRERAEGVDQAIFMYCTHGAGWCDMGGQHHETGPGDLLVIPPSTPHAYGAAENKPWTIHWFHVIGDQTLFLLGQLGVTRESPLVRLGEDSALLALMEDMLDVIEHGYAPAHLLYASQILSHLIGAMIWRQHEHWLGEPNARQKVAQSIAYMKQHMAKTLKVAAVAELAGLSPSHYNALFKEQTGYSPIDFFIRLRMHQACQLLDTTSLSVKRIAAATGYDDPLYFSRVFKGVNDVSPTEYRAKRKG